MEHTLTLTLNRQSSSPHGGKCSCGWKTGGKLVPDFVRSAHDRHLDLIKEQALVDSIDGLLEP